PRRPPRFPYTTLFRSRIRRPVNRTAVAALGICGRLTPDNHWPLGHRRWRWGHASAPFSDDALALRLDRRGMADDGRAARVLARKDRKSTRLNSSHSQI